MNKKQKIVFWVAIVMFGLTLLNAPHQVSTYNGRYTHTENEPLWHPDSDSHLMASTLFVEWLAIGIGAALLMVALRSRKD